MPLGDFIAEIIDILSVEAIEIYVQHVHPLPFAAEQALAIVVTEKSLEI